MVRITLDTNLTKKLLESGSPVELCDEAGRVVGQFFPNGSPYQDPAFQPQISEEELQRREASDRWYTTAQVLEHLKKLEGV